MSAPPVHDGLFQSEPPALLGIRCDECGNHAFPRATTCPYCGSERVTDVTLSDTGTLWGWTTVTAAPPGYSGEVPFGFGIVELPEGLRVITRLALPDDSYTYGRAMRLHVVPLHSATDGTTIETWEFAP